MRSNKTILIQLLITLICAGSAWGSIALPASEEKNWNQPPQLEIYAHDEEQETSGEDPAGYVNPAPLTTAFLIETSATFTAPAQQQRIILFERWDEIAQSRLRSGFLRQRHSSNSITDIAGSLLAIGLQKKANSDGVSGEFETLFSRVTDWGSYRWRLSPELQVSPTSGREYDQEIGLYYFRGRYYDPQLGRFLSQDPQGYSLLPSLYQAFLNNPANYSDPLGLQATAGPCAADPDDPECTKFLAYNSPDICTEAHDSSACMMYWFAVTKYITNDPGMHSYYGEQLRAAIERESQTESTAEIWRQMNTADINRHAARVAQLYDKTWGRLETASGGAAEDLYYSATPIGSAPQNVQERQLAGLSNESAYRRIQETGGQLSNAAGQQVPSLVLYGGLKAAEKFVPNPGGRLGGPLHRKKVAEVEAELRNLGFTKIKNEVEVGGRLVDVVGTNPQTGQKLFIQVGRWNVTGIPVVRETKAFGDIIEAVKDPKQVIFVPYN